MLQMSEPEPMVIDLEATAEPKVNGSQDHPKKTLKRKRASLTLSSDEKAAQIETLKEELQGLFGYYREVMDRKLGYGLCADLGGNESNTMNGMVGLLMEESQLALSKLVGEIHAKIAKDRIKDNVTVTAATVKSAVLFVGQRMMYGVPNVDADVLEDETQDCLWCWETRDLKLMPKHLRGVLKIRRICRKKIHERITAVSAMVSALQNSGIEQNCRVDLVKASDKLAKVSQEADIRLLVDSMLQKNGVEMTDKEAKMEQKLLAKQLEKNKREVEKEKKRIDLELQKEKRQTEKEQKRLQEEAEKDEKRREKEESEMRKQQKKQQKEAEKEQRLKEKEEAEIKRQSAIKKQASIMERFLKRNKSNSPCQNDGTSVKATTSDLSGKMSEEMPEAVTLAMDHTLSSNDDIRIDDIRKMHLSSWQHIGHTIRSNRKQHWSIRKKPKSELFKELKLTVEKLESGWGEQSSDERLCASNLESCPSDKKWKRRKQLLQFHGSHRPAFYGIWPKTSHTIGPRHPIRKEPDLDYDVDSDEEWEEEDPGELLSDCDKDDEEQSLDEGCSKDDEEESEDGFFVPDGYLSENEGVQVDRMETDLTAEEDIGLPSCKPDSESEEFCMLLQQQKYLNKLTETAIRKEQPLIILNLMHEKDHLFLVEDLTGTPKLERMCLEALRMRTFPSGPCIEISTVDMQAEDREASVSNAKPNNTNISPATAIKELDMPVVVSTIQSCSQGINKVVDSLQQKFPTVSKTQLRNKVREISNFEDNRWQVKKEVLDEVGISISPPPPGKNRGRMQSISTFFSKRCMPPTDKNMNNLNVTSPQSCQKPGSEVEGQLGCSYSHL